MTRETVSVGLPPTLGSKYCAAGTMKFGSRWSCRRLDARKPFT